MIIVSIEKIRNTKMNTSSKFGLQLARQVVMLICFATVIRRKFKQLLRFAFYFTLHQQIA
jgi:hypothetical protein